ncbi:MAG TPA: nucleotide exchange factor GrpE [Candidatus Coprousia avicola]|nr:nucleotide exchange factor GrpE [Candidatus Coprousia avicola]
MCARNARTEAAHPAASADSEEKDVKIPVEDADEVRADTPAEPEPVEETPAEGTDTAAADAPEMSEEEMIEAAIRAGEEAAENDFKLKYEQAQNELAEVRRQLAEAEEVREGADARVREATERAARLQADWENFRRRTAAERLAERERATEKLVTALLPVLDDIERAIDHARTQEMADDMKQFVDGVDAVHTKMVDVLAHEGVETIDPAGEAFNPLEHQAVGRVEDPSVFDETVRDVYQKGYRMADRILRAAMVTVTYGGAKRPAPEPADAEEPAREQPSDTATEAPQE